MVAYAEGELGEQLVPLTDVSRIIAIGSDRMMAAVKAARHGVLAAAPAARSRGHRQHQLADAVHDEGGLRAVPAEARGPADRREEFIFSCFNQDQEMDRVDFPNLNARLRQNTVQEKLSNAGSTICSRRSSCHMSKGDPMDLDVDTVQLIRQMLHRGPSGADDVTKQRYHDVIDSSATRWSSCLKMIELAQQDLDEDETD